MLLVGGVGRGWVEVECCWETEKEEEEEEEQQQQQQLGIGWEEQI